MKIYLATWVGEYNQGVSLTKKRFYQRLVSFHFLQLMDQPTPVIQEYTAKGRCDIKKYKTDTDGN